MLSCFDTVHGSQTILTDTQGDRENCRSNSALCELKSRLIYTKARSISFYQIHSLLVA